MNYRLWPRIALLALTVTLGGQSWAQEAQPYTWEAAALILVPPASWDEPLPGEENDEITLQLAQALVNAPDVRPPGVPTITLILLATTSDELSTLLIEALQAQDLEASGEISSAEMAGSPGVEIGASSADGLLFGIGRAAPLPNQGVLLAIGRAPQSQRESFQALFVQVIDSITQTGVEATGSRIEYGVLWHTLRDVSDGDEAFFNLVGLSYRSDQRLFTYEHDLGVVEIDAQTGAVLSISANDAITAPADVAADSTGRVYVADAACACIFVLDTNQGEWMETRIEGFAENSPFSIAVDGGDLLYAADQGTDGTITIQVFADFSPLATISLPEGSFIAPILASSADLAYALTQYGEVLQLSREGALPIATLGVLPDGITDMTVISMSETPQFAIATESQGIFVLDANGQDIARPGRIVPSLPLPGEMVRPGGLVAANETLFFIDSDGAFGAVTAMSPEVGAGRIGSTRLTLNLSVQGSLDESTGQQSWTYEGTAGEQVTIYAMDASESGALNPALRLLQPDGSEGAFNDDQGAERLPSLTDAEIANYDLPADGAYFVMVERIEGSGPYRLGISATRNIDLEGQSVVRLNGALSTIFPVERWAFEGREGQTLTLTLQNASGTLDPLLRLLAPDDSVLAENDDTGDPALGNSAQISSLSLPGEGRYVIEAGRFEGEGRYELIVVVVSP